MQVLREVLRVRIGQDLERELWHRLKSLYKPLVSDVPSEFRRQLALEALEAGKG